MERPYNLRKEYQHDSIAKLAGQKGVAGEDLASLEARCRRKGEAARWAAECQRRIREGADFHGAGDPLDEEKAGWARKLTDGLYWMSSQTASDSIEVSILDDIAGCVDTLAESLALVQESQGRGRLSSQALKYLTEAQSAARRALQRVDIGDDRDQENVHEWIRSTAGGNGSISIVTCELTTWPTRPDGPRCWRVSRRRGAAAARRHFRFPGSIASAIIQNGSRAQARRTGLVGDHRDRCWIGR